MVIAALYGQDGRLESVKRDVGTVSGGGILGGEITATYTEKTKEMRLLAIDSVKGLRPLAPALVPELSDFTVSEALPETGTYVI